MPTPGQPPLPPTTPTTSQPALPPPHPAPVHGVNTNANANANAVGQGVTSSRAAAPGGWMGGGATTKQAADRIVLEYLRRRGYKNAEEAFLSSSSLTSGGAEREVALESVDNDTVDDSLRQILMIVQDPCQVAVSDVHRYSDSYRDLREWVLNSLDVYKPQLATVLYPLLIHSFLEMVQRDHWDDARKLLHTHMHDFIDVTQVIDHSTTSAECDLRRHELFSLFSLASVEHLRENDVAKLYLSNDNRYEVYLSYYAFELLLAFLAEDQRRSVLIRILNQRCRIRFDTASDGVPFVGFRKNHHLKKIHNEDGDADGEDDADVDDEEKEEENSKDKIGIIGKDEKNANMKESEILWGRLRPEHYIMSDEESISIASMKKHEKSFAINNSNSSKNNSKNSKDKASNLKPSDQNKDTNNSNNNNNNNNQPNNNNNNTPNANAQKPPQPTTGAAGAAGAGAGAGEEEEEAQVAEDGTITRSRIPLKRYRSGALGLETSSDLRARAKLRVSEATNGGIRKDLAILFYTITNMKQDGVNCSTVSEDGSQLIAGCGDSTIRIWDARASGTVGSSSGGLNSKATRLIGHNGPVYGVDISKCGRYIISCGEDGMIRLWNINLKSELVTYRGHNFPIWDLKFSPIDHYFLSASHDRTARIWCTERMYPLRILAGHLSDVDCCNWHPNVNYVATGSSDRCVRIWDVRDGQCSKVYRTRSCGSINSVCFSPDGKTIAAGGDGSIIKIWDLRSNNGSVNNQHDGCIKQLKGHRSTIWSLDYSRDGAILASGGADWRVCTWRAEEWSSIVGYDADGNPESLHVKGSEELDAQALQTQQQQANGDAKNEDADGDVKMEDSKHTKTSDAKDKTSSKNTSKNQKSNNRSGAGGRVGSDASNWNDVPLVEVFETKETPVQLVKFTRRNLLVAAGSFGT